MGLGENSNFFFFTLSSIVQRFEILDTFLQQQLSFHELQGSNGKVCKMMTPHFGTPWLITRIGRHRVLKRARCFVFVVFFCVADFALWTLIGSRPDVSRTVLE